ncbi:MAG TPA: helical backbone metal receptor [Chitinophagaceae bacterium]|nr:helical backbone metal receptor [Chitinophagaceae bacterium]
MISLTDQTGRNIILEKQPSKIISLVPSQTELLFKLGLEKETIGITKFCVRPETWFKDKIKVGGTKTLHLDLINKLTPDVIIANKEENDEIQIKALCEEYPVYISDVKNLNDAIKMIEDLGKITCKEESADSIIQQIKREFSKIKPGKEIRTAYFIWQNPYMSVGHDTFINDMMKQCGFYNVLRSKERYPETNIEELNSLNCELLLLSSEPFPFKEKQVEEIKTAGFKGKIMLVDGEMFSWYGSRLIEAPVYFRQLLQLL